MRLSSFCFTSSGESCLGGTGGAAPGCPAPGCAGARTRGRRRRCRRRRSGGGDARLAVFLPHLALTRRVTEVYLLALGASLESVEGCAAVQASLCLLVFVGRVPRHDGRGGSHETTRVHRADEREALRERRRGARGSRTTGVSRVARRDEWRTSRNATALVAATPPARFVPRKRAAVHVTIFKARRQDAVRDATCSRGLTRRAQGEMMVRYYSETPRDTALTRVCLLCCTHLTGRRHPPPRPPFCLPRRVGECGSPHRRRICRVKPQPGSPRRGEYCWVGEYRCGEGIRGCPRRRVILIVRSAHHGSSSS